MMSSKWTSRLKRELTTCAPLVILTVLLIGYPQSSRAQTELPEGFTELATGAVAPDFKLPGVDGKTYTLADFAEPEVLMIYFTGTHCPTSHGVEKRLQTYLKTMQERSFGFLAINPNHSSGLRPDEFGHTNYDETFEDSRRYAEDLGWDFPFLYDGDQQITAREYGCLATPHVFVFDKDRKLRYSGRFDDSRLPDPASVESPDAINAVAALLAGEEVPVAKTRPHGCSTKWKERSAHVAKEEAEWQAAEVVIADADAATIAALRKNGSGKVRLFNVWSTSCAPCVKEMPDLTKIARKFSRREFEMITISLDLPKDKNRAEAFLGKHRAVMSAKLRKSVEAEGRKTNNYLYTGASIDDLVEALDPEWPGPAPYTLVVDPAGEVVYRKVGLIDPAEVTTEILNTLTHYHTTPMTRRPKARGAKAAPARVVEPGYTALFNGKDLDGWKNGGNWRVDAYGAITRSSKGGSLVYLTSKVPDDFDLRFEWKVAAKSNSGLYYRPGQYEYQILDNQGHANGSNPRSSAGSLYFCMPPSHDATKAVGAWNSGRIVCKGSVIQHWVNGEKVIDFDYTDPAYAWEVGLLKRRGGDLAARGASLSLQDHGDPVWYRHLRWKALGAEDKIDASKVKYIPTTAEEKASEEKKVAGIEKRRAEAVAKKKAQK